MKEKKLTLRDRFALISMSQWNYFWNIYEGHKNVVLHIILFFILPYNLSAGVIMSCGIENPLLYVILSFTAAFYLSHLVATDLIKRQICSNFKNSAWWKNTGISPWEVMHNQDLYGEFMASGIAELRNKKQKIHGVVFNNVIVPKKDGSFTEIDVVNVNEYGIDVIEAKCRGGVFTGSVEADQWVQNIGNEQNVTQSPLMQNQNHRNYLSEYLYETLPRGHARVYCGTSRWMRNVVLNAHPYGGFDLDGRLAPENFLLSPTLQKNGYLTYEQELGKEISPRDVDEIAEAIRPIASYTLQQRSAFQADRKLREMEDSYHAPAEYYLVEGTLKSSKKGGTAEEVTTICRDTGEYKTYLGSDFVMFYAMPGLKVTAKTQSTTDYQKIFTFFRRKMGAHRDPSLS